MPHDQPLILDRRAAYYLASSRMPGSQIEEHIMALDIHTGHVLYQVPLKGTGLGYHYLPLLEGFQRPLTSTTCAVVNINGREVLINLVAHSQLGLSGQLMQQIESESSSSRILKHSSGEPEFAVQVWAWAWPWEAQAQWMKTEMFGLNCNDGLFYSQESYKYMFPDEKNEVDRAKLCLRPFKKILAAGRPARGLEIETEDALQRTSIDGNGYFKAAVSQGR
ncbi:hypothetical protein BJY01DRAFT_244709 [Aspergillus pseudoustus]|uniref:Uncharacterized protein n=1 Tax=Aspergillus pseudoustus TaxID=1810923 RepID=A0ABR4KII9_9EURO